MTKKLFKSLAIALTAITLSLPLTSTTALAAGHQGGSAPQRTEMRQQQRAQASKQHKPKQAQAPRKNQPQRAQASHKNQPQAQPMSHREPQPVPKSAPQEESHSDIGNFITGTIVGGVLGAVIANNC